MQHTNLILSVTYTLQELHVFIPSIYSATVLSCGINTVLHNTSILWRCIIGADSFPSTVS